LDIYRKAMAYASHGVSCYGKGFLEEAIEHLLQGADLCERCNDFFWNAIAQHFLSETYFEIGEYQKSKDRCSKGIWLTEHNKMTSSWINMHKISLARAKVMNREEDVDLELLYGYVNENVMRIYDGRMPRCIGEILLNLDDHHITESEEWVKKAIEVDKRNGMKFYLGKDYALYAEQFKRKGDQLEAKENLGKAIEMFKECSADGWVEKVEKELT
jgi:tetratricopeptide (TPR) repeat protein